MKSKRLLPFLLAVSAILCLTFFSACTPSPNDTKKPIDNTAASLIHNKIYLWEEGNVPYDEDGDCREFCFITPYLAPYPTGGAVLVFPGGAYKHLSNSTNSVVGYGQGVDNEGDQKESSSIASWYNAAGISVFVVNYRTKAVDSTVDYHHILSDASRAMRYVRYHAREYYLDENKIAVQGYSAGGHLASMLLTQPDWVIDDETYVADDIDRVSAVPNAGVLCYSVITMQDGLTHKTTRKNFTGGDKTLYDRFSAEKRVTPQTSPCFLWCHENDGTCSSANTYAMAQALEDSGVYYERHIFDDNGTTAHGIGVAQDYEQAREWPTLATNFLKSLSF